MDQKQFNSNLVLYLLFAALMAVVIFWGISHMGRPGSLSPSATSDTRADLSPQDRYEAREWLRAHPNTMGSPIAASRFGTFDQALEFIEKLYAAGAAKVEVTNIYAADQHLKSEGGPFAYTLIVTLPTEEAQRLALFDIANQEAAGQGEGTVTDMGQTEFRLSWN